MEESALRDVDRNAERWRDKIELRLDNRQVFFLFFGSAVVACMLFVLGVMVGKRIESRGQAASPDLQDPLAALDRAHKPVAGAAPAPAPQLTFPNTLIAPPTLPRPKAVKIASVAPAPKPVPLAAPPKPIAPIAVAPEAPKPIAPALAPKAPKPIAAVVAPKPIAAALAPKPIAAAPAPKPIAAAVAPKPIVPLPAASTKPIAAAPADPATAKAKGKYTLHLSTFATADEANAFAQRYPGAFVISGDVAGRGATYRVRYGNFPSYKDATSAKETFEKQHGTIALIAAR
jgi:septal ring-binding cell division protein DamX